MEACPDCRTLLEPFEVVCHNCGKQISQAAPPSVSERMADKQDLEDAFESWLSRAEEDLTGGKYEEAIACCHEAYKRSQGFKPGDDRRIQVRVALAGALEKAEKYTEALEQYSQLYKDGKYAPQLDEWKNKIAQLKPLADMLVIAIKEGYGDPVPFESKYAPLYCAHCKRLLSEAEAFNFRKDGVLEVRCLCGNTGKPLVKRDSRHYRSLEQAEKSKRRKQLFIEAAGASFDTGKQKTMAAILAVFLGIFGVHRFYLGERDSGLLFLLYLSVMAVAFLLGLVNSIVVTILVSLSWIVALMDAITYATMSAVTFNLHYNVELVLEKIPAEAVSSVHDAQVFSMEITEDPEDFVDEYTTPRNG